MFDIGFWELLLIAAIGLLVLGPERLPGAIRSVQRGYAKIKAFGSKMEAELNHELRVKELHDHLKQIESSADMENLSPELKRSLKELEDAAASVRSPYAAKDKDTAVADLAEEKAKAATTSTEEVKSALNEELAPKTETLDTEIVKPPIKGDK
ncbi:twin arginine-targeting protein translocase TatB [Idiomarina sp. A28L]|uniref:Sec-independent protein translocase protein TatB n=1 Tax=Idiomarina sp. A28L TaxID=1036674 RepID=UPI0002138BA8|nr:Sec-independent protein translocase protein TatB [Idiomarina sp. A28L]EGN75402.1 twin arginine-targeting protein translocase TatB [Idiomarina sp. A28L]